MPSASSKSEKPASTETTDPLKQAIVIIGHKIRNLEKRKSRLDSYKESINTLTKEQVEAISKYDEVVQQLELSKEYVKQFTVISVESDKLKKKQAKKDAQEKYLAEVNKVKQVLLIQDILQNMSIYSVREDFLAGRNGALQLTKEDIKILDDLFAEVSPGCISKDKFQKAAEYFMAIIEGKAKEVAGSTGSKLRELVNSIHTCGYFDQQPTVEANNTIPIVNQESKSPEEQEELHKNQEILSNVIVPTQNSSEGKIPPTPSAAPIQPLLAGAPILPAAAQGPLIKPSQPIMTPNVPNIVPTPVSQVESSFFNAQGFKPPAPPSAVPPPSQSSRQISDIIQSVTGKFNFLQESELEITEINSGVVPGNPSVAPPQIPGAASSAIPTRTFTNQNFNGQPGGAPTFPSNYPPQQGTFQTFVPAFPAFVPPNASSVQNANSNSSTGNPTTVVTVNNSGNPNIPNNDNTSNSNNSSNTNNIPNPIPVAPNRNPSVSFNQGQQQMPSTYTNQTNTQNIPQPPNQSGFQHGNSLNVASVESISIEETVRVECEMKDKQENEKQNWNQPETSNWADDWVETSEWNSTNQNQSDGTSNSNKYPLGRHNRNGGGVSKNTNGYQGNRNRPSRPGGYRESSNSQGGGGCTSINYYQNQNGYQPRNDRNNDYAVGGKPNPDIRDNTFKERGDCNNRDRENRDNYGGGFKRGPNNNRGPNMKGPMDRGDRQGQIPRNNTGGTRPARNINRQSGGRGGPSFQRQQPNQVGQTSSK